MEPSDDLLLLPYDAFDQSDATGWRPVAHSGDCARAAALIEAYLARHADLADWQIRVLNFHAVQMHAFAGNDAAALEHIDRTREPDGPADPRFCWNDYVDATAAFLRRDADALRAAVARMEAATAATGDIPNLRAARRLLSNFDLPYRNAY